MTKIMFYNPLLFAAMLVAMVTKVTMVIELIGINIAATIGDSLALTAKLNPMTLYKMEMIQLVNTTFLPALA